MTRRRDGSREPPLPKGRGTALAVEGYILNLQFRLGRRDAVPYDFIKTLYFIVAVNDYITTSLFGRSKPLPYGLIYIYHNLWDDGLMLF